MAQKLSSVPGMELRLAAAQAVCAARQWYLCAFFLPEDLSEVMEQLPL